MRGPAFGFIFLRRSLAFDLGLFCLSFFDHVIVTFPLERFIYGALAAGDFRIFRLDSGF